MFYKYLFHNNLFLKIESVEKQEEATTKEVDRIYKILKKKTKDGQRPICFFKFTINPESFGQTVENIFHVAFLIKVFWYLCFVKKYFSKICSLKKFKFYNVSQCFKIQLNVHQKYLYYLLLLQYLFVLYFWDISDKFTLLCISFKSYPSSSFELLNNIVFIFF